LFYQIYSQMSHTILLKNAGIVNENKIVVGSIVIENQMIKDIIYDKDIEIHGAEIIDLTGKYLLPGVIDDQVHFREPGLTYKADIASESRAAVAGGVTSYMDMPNNNPPILTKQLLEEKYENAANKSLANYSFYMGTSNDNMEEMLKINPKEVCGVKVFMGSSTGNMLVNNPESLVRIFSETKMLIATHCEDDPIIRKNLNHYKSLYGDEIPVAKHGEIRSAEACYKSSSYAVALAKKYGTRLHVLHLSTAQEMNLFNNDIPLKDKKITSEVCVHHLTFSDKDYAEKGNSIKWNPAIKTEADRQGLLEALKDGKLDVVATDHAPHLKEEKERKYTKAPSGGPLVQHSLQAMLEFFHRGEIPLETIVEKMCHAPAICFQVKNRGFIRKGYYADLVVVDINKSQKVMRENIYYKCGWSPFEGKEFRSTIEKTFVNGNLVFNQGKFDDSSLGMRLKFRR